MLINPAPSSKGLFHSASSGRGPVIAEEFIYGPKCLSPIFYFTGRPLYPANYTVENYMPV